MIMILRDYQQSIYNQLVATQADCVFQLDTGGGKTAIIAKLNDKPTINIAHRNFLVEQISQTLTLNNVPHKIIASPNIVKRCQLFGRNHGLDQKACEISNVYVGTIQSIVSRHRNDKLNIDTQIPFQIIIDECHHVADGNMWAKLKDVFVNAHFVGATATPCRLDGRGLHKNCGGLFDKLIQAEQLKENGMLWLIANNYLADYEAYTVITLNMSALQSTFDKLSKQNIAKDFTKKELEKWADGNATIEVQGSIMKHYQELAEGKTAIVFCPSIKIAEQMSQIFKRNGYNATYIASTLSLSENMRRIDAFKSGQVKILCNVEMATEGFDLPSAECLIILRPTASLVLHRQMVGRVMRAKDGSKKAIIIDHVGNILRHGLPDDEINWSLTGTPKNKSERVCACDKCNFVYNAYIKECPNCGAGNWLRSQDAEGVRAVELGYIDIGLVRKIRTEIAQKQIKEQEYKAQQERQKQLETQITPSYRFHAYQDDIVGKMCYKLSHWFLDNIQKSSIEIKEINKFVNSTTDFMQFWLDNFTVKDLKSDNVAKCERVLKKWLKSR